MKIENKKLFGLPIEAIAKINTVFTEHPLIQQVLIFGSRATGLYKNGSDIDLCLKANNLSLTEQFKIEMKLDDLLLPWKIDLCNYYNLDNRALLQHITDKGLIFYETTI